MDKPARRLGETPVSSRMSGNKDGEWKVTGVIPRWLPTSLWGPVAAISAMRNVFLFHYVGDILLTSEPLSSLKVAALWLVAHLAAG